MNLHLTSKEKSLYHPYTSNGFCQVDYDDVYHNGLKSTKNKNKKNKNMFHYIVQGAYIMSSSVRLGPGNRKITCKFPCPKASIWGQIWILSFVEIGRDMKREQLNKGRFWHHKWKWMVIAGGNIKFTGVWTKENNKFPLPWWNWELWEVSMKLGFQGKQRESTELRCLSVG